MQEPLFSRARLAYFLFGLGIVAALIASSTILAPRMDRLLQESSLLESIWRYRGRAILALAVVYFYTWPCFLAALLLYLSAPAEQKPDTMRLRSLVLGAMVTALVLPPAAAALFYASVVWR